MLLACFFLEVASHSAFAVKTNSKAYADGKTRCIFFGILRLFFLTECGS